jgi:hypothetical protein
VLAAAIIGSTLALPVPAGAGDALKLIPAGTYQTGVFPEGGAEIVAHDPATQRMFITHSGDKVVDVVSIQNVEKPRLVFRLDISPCGDGLTSVAVKDGLAAVAVVADPRTDPGSVALFDTIGTLIKCVGVGALPDMVTFTPDETKVLVANEGEADSDNPATDPNGSVSIIAITNGAIADTPTTIGFGSFDGQEEVLRHRGVRIFNDAGATIPTSRDVEPEYIAVSSDSSTAFVVLQEANGFAVIDLTNLTLRDILPVGYKDHSKGLPSVKVIEWTNRPLLGTTAGGQQILLGGLSGLWVEQVDPDGTIHFVTVPDRGPNGEPTNVDADPILERPFALPDYQARVLRGTIDPALGQVRLTQTIVLTRQDGVTPITGRPNIPGVDEEPVDLFGSPLPYDEFGADLEGIVVAPDGTFWMVDEYRPAIYHFASNGVLIDRFVPVGTGALGGMPAGTFGTETLPAEYSTRRANRGFEGMAWDSDSGVLYAFIQTPLANPNTAASNASSVIRMLGINPATGVPVAEYVYLLEKPSFRPDIVDKIGDAAYVGHGRFLAVERDSSVDSFSKKMMFEFDIKGATNVLGMSFGAETLEQQTADNLVAAGVRPVFKLKVANLPSIGYLAGDKTEGLATLPDGRLLVVNDDDFGLLPQPLPNPPDGTVALDPTPVPVAFGLIEFSRPNGLDPSDRDTGINIAHWPVLGMIQPDGIAAFEVGGEQFYVTANEGDDRADFGRETPTRINSLALDGGEFPNAATLKQNANLGRLNASDVDGDIDGDGDFDRLFVYGGRSFSIWDRFGNLVYDNGDLLEQITAAALPADFNSTNDENDTFEDRSDNKGPEPEAVVTGKVKGKLYAFVGLERIGGVAVFNIDVPRRPTFVQYINGAISTSWEICPIRRRSRQSVILARKVWRSSPRKTARSASRSCWWRTK